MPLPTVAPATSLDPSLIAEIRDSLDSDDPQRETLDEYVRGASDHTATVPVVFVARVDGAFAGYARVHRHAAKSPELVLDMIVPRNEPDVALALYNTVKQDNPHQVIHWWTQDAIVHLADAVATTLGLSRTRSVERMERELGELDVFADVTTRAYVPADATEVVRINNDAFADHVDRANYTVVRLASDLEHLNNRYADLRLMEHDHSVSGFVWLKEHSERIGEIFVLAVDHHHRGTGLGAKLLDAGVVYLYETFKSTRAMLYVESTNTHAIELYTKHNFVNVDRPRVLFQAV